MKKKLIISSIILGLIILLTGLFWAYKTGKLAGLADVLEQEQADFGVRISVKYEDNSPASGVLVEVCTLEKGASDWDCYNLPTNSEGKVDIVGDCVKGPDGRCPIPSPVPPEILYYKYRPIKDGYCPEPPFSILRYDDVMSKLNYLNFILKLNDECGGAVSGKGSMSGFVYDADVGDDGETRIADALITLSGASGSGIVSQVRSNLNGTYNLRGIPAGNYTFTCSKEGYETVRSSAGEVIIEAGKDRAGRVGMHKAPPPKDKFTLLGNLSNAHLDKTAVIADAKISISQTYAGTTYYYDRKSTSDPKINIVAEDIPLKPKNAPESYNPPYYPYHISITHPEFEVLEQDFGFELEDLQYDRSRDAWVWYRDFVLIPRQTFKVFGKVTESMPIPGLAVQDANVIVELYKGSEAQHSYTAKTDKKGNYLISGVAFNPYLLYYFKVEHPYYRKINQGPVQFSEIPKAIIEGGTLESALKKDFVLDPGGIDCKKILGERCPFGKKLVSIAISQIGVKEIPPGSNCVLYNKCSGVAWCDTFVNWVFGKAGFDYFYKNCFQDIFCSREYLQKNGTLIDVTNGDTSQIQQGDYFWLRANNPSGWHAGLVEYVSGREIHTIEGNVGPAGEVAKQIETAGNAVGQIWYVGRPKNCGL